MLSLTPSAIAAIEKVIKGSDTPVAVLCGESTGIIRKPVLTNRYKIRRRTSQTKKGRGQTLEGTESLESQIFMEAVGPNPPSDTARRKNVRPSVSFPRIQK